MSCDGTSLIAPPPPPRIFSSRDFYLAMVVGSLLPAVLPTEGLADEEIASDHTAIILEKQSCAVHEKLIRLVFKVASFEKI